MNIEQRAGFLPPQEARAGYSQIAEVYRQAFAGPPWFEVSKCPSTDLKQRCASGFAQLAVGELCGTCKLAPSEAAYTTGELTTRFEELAVVRPTQWYFETVGGKLALAALAYRADTGQIWADKYSTTPHMTGWLMGKCNRNLIWLDEVFANTDVRQKGNLANFGAMCRGFSQRMGSRQIAFRTINRSLIAAARRDFPDAQVFKAQTEVPDWRNFVIVNVPEERP